MTDFKPEENAVVTQDGQTVYYKYLVVCPGIQINWDNVHTSSLIFRAMDDSRFGHALQVKGLREALGKKDVSSNYSYEYADKTWVSAKSSKQWFH